MLALKATGTYLTTASEGSFFTHLVSSGSSTAQCEQAYEKNSSTSTLPGSVGCTGFTSRYLAFAPPGAPCVKPVDENPSANTASTTPAICLNHEVFICCCLMSVNTGSQNTFTTFYRGSGTFAKLSVPLCLLSHNRCWDFFLSQPCAGLIHVINFGKRPNPYPIDLKPIDFGALYFNGHAH